MGEVLRDERSAHLLVTDEVAAGEGLGFSRGEWFAAHVIVFIVGCWNLVLIDFVHTRERWWSWQPVVFWSGVLVVHGGWVLLMRRAARRSARAGRAAREVSGVAPDHHAPVLPTEPQPRQPFHILVARDGKSLQPFGSGMADGALD